MTYKTSNGKTAAVFETVIPGFGFVVEIVTFRVKYRGAFNSGSAYSANMSSVSTNVTARACKVTSGATNSVTLPTLVSASLKATGDVASARSAPFSVGLNCDANVSVYATLIDASNPANTGSALSLAPVRRLPVSGFKSSKKARAPR
ncbi:fimbrial protein [Burkholderia ambifaria]|uniref:fimbrial protein n=1 Tax=Burkholderia ambifaria TaxID=152480 RepID=UPI001BA0D445|nr:fimbrial protein [Burkholderia ambifaria]